MMPYGNSPFNMSLCKDTDAENESIYSALSQSPPLQEDDKDCNYVSANGKIFEKRHSVNSDEVSIFPKYRATLAITLLWALSFRTHRVQ